jgi:hypothetical protein
METLKKIKSFEQFLSEKTNTEEVAEVKEVAESVEVTEVTEVAENETEKKSNEMLVSITKTVVVNNDEKSVWDIHEDFIKEVTEITEDAEGFVFSGDGFDRKNNDEGGFEMTSNIQFLYNAPDADEKDLKSMFRNLSGDVDIEISEVEVE